jgi:hypothetical protein
MKYLIILIMVVVSGCASQPKQKTWDDYSHENDDSQTQAQEEGIGHKTLRVISAVFTGFAQGMNNRNTVTCHSTTNGAYTTTQCQ